MSDKPADWLRLSEESRGPLTREQLGKADDGMLHWTKCATTEIPEGFPGPLCDCPPLYRAQYECRHCLERFTADRAIEQRHIKLTIESCSPILHNCTPDIIGIADLQSFVKQ